MQHLKEEEFAAWNEQMSRKYSPDSFHQESTWLVRAIEAARIRFVLEFLAAAPSERVLEVGCGTGNILEKIPCGQLYGVDLSDAMIAKACQRLGQRATIQKANAEQLPFEEGYFDKVICTEVLEHVQHPEKVIVETARVLAGHGCLILSVPNDLLIARLKRVLVGVGVYRFLLTKRSGYEIPVENEWHLHTFSSRAIRRMVEPYFCVERVRRAPFPLLPVHFVFKCLKRSGNKL
jgi:ubiquinone/menaquinone biosynthesis C-methylase UbiE